MNHHISHKKMITLLICGIIGCIFMGGSDWLMIYGDTSFEGSLAWLTAGVASVPAWRNTLSLIFAFPAIIFYSIALFGIRYLIHDESSKRTYCALTAYGLTPWMCLHLFYIMILYLFAFLNGNGYAADSLVICEALFSHFAWLVPACDVVILLPFLYYIIITARGKTVFSRWMAFNNPLLIFVILKVLTGLFPDTPLRLAFTNGLMSECMIVWFVIFIIALNRKKA